MTFSQVLVLLLSITSTVFASPTEVNLLGSFVRDSNQLVHYDIVKPALEMAVEEANERFKNHLRFTMSVRNDTTSCYMNMAGAVVAEEYFSHKKFHAIFGPSCDLALDQVGRLAAYWKLPLFTAGGLSTQFSDKDTYQTLTRLSFSVDRVSHFIIKILREHDWHHISLFVDETDVAFISAKKSFYSMVERERLYDGYDIQHLNFDIRKTEGNVTDNIADCLTQARKRSRVILLMIPPVMIRDVLLIFKDLNFEQKEFVFLAVELIKEARGQEVGWYRLGSRRNPEAKTMYESLMVVSVRIPVSDEFESFANKVAKRASASSDSDMRFARADVNPIVAAFYDAVLVYALAANQTLGARNTSETAADVIKSIWGRRFNDIGLTGDILINQNGDREADYTLNDMDPETGVMVPVATYFGSEQKYEKMKGMEIHWPGGGDSPPDIPRCGFRGEAEKCQAASRTPIIVSSVIVLVVILTVTGISIFFIQKRIKEEQQINDLWWKIEASEVEIIEKKKGRGSSASASCTSTDRIKSNVSLSILQSACSLGKKSTTSKVSGTNYSTTITNLSGIDIAMFRSLKVAVKTHSLKTRVYLTKDVLVEMNKMRECQLHDNLVKFYGMTMDETCWVVNELCIRGSLRDIMENESIEIDWLFRYSILTDVVEGMYFLHSSSLKYHGHLKSSNLLVDGRFTVKISDYGLNCIYDRLKHDDETNPRDLFWTAPEHLRSRDPLRSGSQKGDVYSFAVICREVITRMGPYEPTSDINGTEMRRNLDPDEILDKVRMGGVPPFRPELNATDCLESPELLALTRECWAENPNERHDFGRIKINMRKITKGQSSKNFLDNLLKRLEQYSNSLEAIVSEKTQTIVEEKEKAEELIHQMLPSFIAKELKLGKHVAPENFDSVTIYFSDLIGFREMSDAATPEQAVDMLNDVYTTMDTIISTYDVFKVETIADSYLVASGVPVRNGNEHARNIARMALDLRIAMRNFKPRHEVRGDHKMSIRIGINSGSCVAGVVGLKLPKYCLFGDAINTASRMETNGEPGRIHISAITKSILDLFGSFIVIPRGEIEIKGKGKVKTFWLEGEDRTYK